jgi:hypothetical protein
MSIYLYDVCSTVWCLLNCMMSAQLYEVCLPYNVLSIGWCLPRVIAIFLYNFFLCLHGVWSTVWCLSTCMMSAQLYVVCLPEWCLLSCMMPAYLYDVFSTEWKMFAHPYDVCLPLYLPTCMMSVNLYYVCLRVKSRLNCKMSAYWHNYYLPVLCLTTCTVHMMCGYLVPRDVCVPVWYLATRIMSSCLSANLHSVC